MAFSSVKQFLAAATVAGAALTAPTAEAGPILLTVQGTAANSASNGVVSAGDLVKYSFLYDPDLAGADTNPAANSGRFAPVISGEVSINNNAYLFSSLGGSVNQTQTGANAQWNMTGSAITTGLPTGVNSLNYLLSFVDNGNDADVVFSDPNLYSDIQDRLSYFNSLTGIMSFGNRGRPGDNISVNLDLSTLKFQDVKEEPPVGNVPEPASVALVALGLAGLAATRRRNERSPV